jgi:8-oxo-dGTP pyrophosphatase MutT (NUDIX family)
MTHGMDEGRAAATVVIVRDRADNAPEFLMMERASTMAFAAGALVFPGGAVDPGDRELAAAIGGDLHLDEASARVAAIRETLEECGLGIGLTGDLDMAILSHMRAALASGEGLGPLLDRFDVGVDLNALVPFARWHPGGAEAARRVYDTRFYLARAPEGQEPSVDATENVRLFWSGSAATLARSDAGEVHVIFPTRRNLERLGLFTSLASLTDHALSTPIDKVRPWIEEREGEPFLCIPDHLGYPVTAEALRTVKRG